MRYVLGVFLTVLMIHVSASAKQEEVITFNMLMGECKEGINKERNDISQKDKAEFNVLGVEYDQSMVLLTKAPLYHIPKQLHFIWIGPREFPKTSINNVRTWKKHHPGWTINFWTDSPTRPLPIPEMKRRLVQNYDCDPLTPFIKKSDNWGEKSDMYRYMILFNEGGVYVDHDIECFRSIEPFVTHFDMVVGLERPHHHARYDTSVLPHNALICIKPHHIVLRRTIDAIVSCWDDAEKKFSKRNYMSNLHRVIWRTFDSFSYAAKTFRNKGKNRDIILPTSYFYPYRTFKRSYIDHLTEKGFVYAVHEYAGTWLRTKPKESPYQYGKYHYSRHHHKKEMSQILAQVPFIDVCE